MKLPGGRILRIELRDVIGSKKPYRYRMAASVSESDGSVSLPNVVVNLPVNKTFFVALERRDDGAAVLGITVR
jgi:hypothetical protein